jgi:flagellar P-ring protein precursor FlgI
MQRPERQMEFVARVENASFVPDVTARIVINERTGTVVANANIQISKVAVAYGNLTVSVTSAPEVSQPDGYVDNSLNIGGQGGDGGPSGNGGRGIRGRPGGNSLGGDGGRGGNAGGNSGVKTEVVNRTTTNVQEEKRSLVVLNDMPTVEDVAFALNSMGATPRELMSILQSIKDAGALNAELVLE